MRVLHSHNRVLRQGIALIVVLLIILGATAIGIVTLKLSQYDSRTSMSHTFARQAQQNAHQVALFMENDLTTDAQTYFTAQNHQVAVNGEKIKNFSGMHNALPTTDDTTRLKGDLARPVDQCGAVSGFSLISEPVAGFSEENVFCSYLASTETYSRIGSNLQAINSVTNEDKTVKFYLLSDLNAAALGFKREIGTIRVEPLKCYE